MGWDFGGKHGPEGAVGLFFSCLPLGVPAGWAAGMAPGGCRGCKSSPWLQQLRQSLGRRRVLHRAPAQPPPPASSSSVLLHPAPVAAAPRCPGLCRAVSLPAGLPGSIPGVTLVPTALVLCMGTWGGLGIWHAVLDCVGRLSPCGGKFIGFVELTVG